MIIVKICSIFLLCFISLAVSAQNDFDVNTSNRLALYASLYGTANFDDFGLGTALGIVSRSRTFAIYTMFEARPYRRAILHFQGGNRFIQYREERYLIGLGGEYLKNVWSKQRGVFGQVNIGQSWGHWGGIVEEPDKGVVIAPRVGVFKRIGKNGVLKLGYSYQPTKSDDISMHRAFLSITGFAEND